MVCLPFDIRQSYHTTKYNIDVNRITVGLSQQVAILSTFLDV